MKYDYEDDSQTKQEIKSLISQLTYSCGLLLLPHICVSGAPLITVGGWERDLFLRYKKTHILAGQSKSAQLYIFKGTLLKVNSKWQE